MAPPKKNLEKTNSAKPESEVKKKRVYVKKNVKDKPVKPKLKVPSIIRIKIPNPKSSEAPSVSAAEPVTNSAPMRKKLVTNEAKIQMANEVLKTILIKSKSHKAANPSVDSTAESCNRKPLKGPVKRQCRKKVTPEEIVTEDPEQSCEGTSEELFECPQPKKKVIRKPVKKQIKNEVLECPGSTKKVCKNPVKKEIKSVPVKAAAPTKVKVARVRKPKVKNETLPIRKTSARLKKNNDNDNPTEIKDIAAKIECNITENKPLLPVPVSKPSVANGDTTDSRRTSLSSSLSWTKDISSSSTTTCYTVRTDDFFKIDNKLPIVELKKIEYNNQNTTSNDSSSSSSDTSSTTSNTDHHTYEIVSTPDLKGGRSPNLSVSSISRIGSSPKQKTYPNEDINTFEKALKALDKVKLMMNNLNLEILSWIAEKPISINPKMKSRETIIEQLRQENDIAKLYKQCEKKINKQSNVDTSNGQTPNVSSTYTDKNLDFTSDVIVGNFSNNSSPTKLCNDERFSDNNIDGEYGKRDAYHEGTQYSDETRFNDKTDDSDSDYEDTRYRNESKVCDDDDALSLFAEGSITGGESYRHSSSVASIQYEKNNETDEYVPQPLSTHISPTARYQPSKIVNNFPFDADYPKHDEDDRPNDDEVFKVPNRIQKPHSVHFNRTKQDLKNNTRNQSTKPVLMSSIYKWMKGEKKSGVFKDVCFFNLVKVCNREKCSFPHAKVPVTELKNRLTRLSEEVFIKEYMVARTWDELRRIYGMCFVEECAKRELTNILIEMAMDFISKTNPNIPNDIKLKVAVIETTLLHLNKVDLTTCKDFLTYKFGPRVLLCDLFMKAIAETQNFSRFKIVFINLTNFMIRENRSFPISVAENILERVSILPCEEPVARALICILNNTDKNILQNSMLRQFEAQLKSLNTELFKELQLVKLKLLMTQNVEDTLSSNVPKVMEDTPMNGPNNEQEIRYSPETPNQDAMNQLSDQTMGCAPVDSAKRTHSFTVTNNYAAASSPSNERDEIFRHSLPGDRFNQWREPSFNSPVFGAGNRARPWMRGQNKRRFEQRSIAFGATPPKFPRRF